MSPGTVYDVLVLGGGHAGIEAALSAARLGCRVALVAADRKRIGEMSCNPAIGGVAKGILVREIDALGGSMGRGADACGIQFRMLNRSKGPAVWGPRKQEDADLYSRWQLKNLRLNGVEVLEDVAERLLGETSEVEGLRCRRLGSVRARAVVIAAGTFLGGKLFRGSEQWTGGRIGDVSAERMEQDMRRRMFHVKRFKTGTPPRITRRSLNLSVLDLQEEDGEGYLFGHENSPEGPGRERCYLTRSNRRTAEVVKRFIDQSPLYGGRISGVGPRYCPSFEDKVMKFPDRESHALHVEPMGIDSRWMYLNGLSTSLPRRAQEKMVRSVEGLRGAEIAVYGYAVEYGYFDGAELNRTLRLLRTGNVFAAGQVCGTSGYEEAAAMGLLAGANAARICREEEPVRLSRARSYMGVMIDDVVGKGLTEPYRLFSSRSENRLHLRPDNADRRMAPVAERIFGSAGEWLEKRLESAGAISKALRSARVEGKSLMEHCRRPEVGTEEVLHLAPGIGKFDAELVRSVVLDEKYRGYIERSERRIEQRKRMENVALSGIDSYRSIREICYEARVVLERERPATLGEAAGLPGVRPSDVEGIIVHLARERST
ncbi:tRNA uridine-5-carboxymethylaminomethyl(34) synthesis enzyme MnmG [Candidatus Fermentibacteria bacterium]|nr:tRNA uridine-5-carboxymethylaminomethyl(34) synthesis enzyme MnmG [Candidatus Fermentibacteria bacterium]